MGHLLTAAGRHMTAAVLAITLILAARMAIAHSATMGHADIEGVAGLDVCVEGSKIHLLIAVTRRNAADRAVSLQYLRSDDGGTHWNEPVEVNRHGPAVYARRGMDPQIAARGEHVVTVWTTRSDNRFGRGPMASALSDDGGRNWRSAGNPADDRSEEDHGMMDLAVDAAGVFHLAWLDARNGQKGLIYAQSADHGQTWSSNVTLNPATCECCWTALATDSGSVAILYRQLHPRDMAAIISGDGGKTWAKPVRVGDFGWEVHACPHCGGGMAFTSGKGGSHCHAAVWTGYSPTGPGVYALSSPDGGRQWGLPQRLGDHTACHPAISAADGGEAVVAWDAMEDDHSRIYASRTKDNGVTWSHPTVLSDGQCDASHPRIVRTGGRFVVFWTRQSHDARATWQSAGVP